MALHRGIGILTRLHRRWRGSIFRRDGDGAGAIVRRGSDLGREGRTGGEGWGAGCAVGAGVGRSGDAGGGGGGVGEDAGEGFFEGWGRVVVEGVGSGDRAVVVVVVVRGLLGAGVAWLGGIGGCQGAGIVGHRLVGVGGAADCAAVLESAPAVLDEGVGHAADCVPGHSGRFAGEAGEGRREHGGVEGPGGMGGCEAVAGDGVCAAAGRVGVRVELFGVGVAFAG